jgi:hypothetical protein
MAESVISDLTYRTRFSVLNKLKKVTHIRAPPLAASVQSNQKRNYIFVINHVVSYERRLWPEQRPV